MNTSQKTWMAVAVVIVILLIIGGVYMYKQNAIAPSGDGAIAEQDNVQGNEFASKCGLIIENTTVDASVSFPLTIEGTVDNTGADIIGCSWTMSEGQAGVAELFYQTKDGWSLAADTQPIKVDDWMSTSTSFSVTLKFDNSKEQFPAGYNFKVVFTEENPSGEGDVDMIELPLLLK